MTGTDGVNPPPPPLPRLAKLDTDLPALAQDEPAHPLGEPAAVAHTASGPVSILVTPTVESRSAFTNEQAINPSSLGSHRLAKIRESEPRRRSFHLKDAAVRGLKNHGHSQSMIAVADEEDEASVSPVDGHDQLRELARSRSMPGASQTASPAQHYVRRENRRDSNAPRPPLHVVAGVSLPSRAQIHAYGPPESVQNIQMESTTRSAWEIPPGLKAWIPLMIWAAVSLAFALIVLVWHTEVFSGLDRLSAWLKTLGFKGYCYLFGLIFITTMPPLPLYSTLIILSGYAFGMPTGFVISYTAALSGAVVVFVLSRYYFRQQMLSLLDKSPGLKKVVRAIDRKPRLLFLIRFSPYPYNVMNVILASSECLSFKTYTLCTALALPKLVIHVTIGSTIRNFSAYHSDQQASGDDVPDDDAAREAIELEASGRRLKEVAGTIGLLLCIGLFVYILIVARRAVDEIDDVADSEQRLGLLPHDEVRSSDRTTSEHQAFQLVDSKIDSQINGSLSTAKGSRSPATEERCVGFT
ncbi:uncharacterized protein L969DRAFT_89550 [Mixia osmundae IAM 14324]|uniref:Golgi apparatus membrane protein TVP38 n=1 Tax=Mixia osmundae (strain CBS 9802 / IAM 14324 / JCM 22182 / KY 12970) TaxID=764103 RepID=G7EA36_MIXOS|nr:uncharacterized protein L969DRAFT_89550 [Mixia osmundae IAM 14324]KEI37595.1 hypothetical protein L969DRAFT_89550 [Mixia osmundae IAM 14324]GAA99696.1 hypothetical protein E5Q_06399 [Mixia osmundae IAM 14324]